VLITYCLLDDPGATTGPSSACGPVTLGIENPPDPTQTGIIYAWQASTTGDVDANYTATGGTAATYDAIVGVPTWFRCRMECTATGAFVLSSALLVSPDPPNAGSDATLSICNTAPPENMFDLLGSDAEEGGTWSGPSPVSNGLFNPATMVGGAYVYTVFGIAPCPNATATVTVVIDPCLGIDELNAQHGWTWLGQLADGIHSFRNKASTILGWELFDASGRMVASSSTPIQGDLVHIPLSQQKSGIYMVRMNTAEGTSTVRIIHEN